MPAHIVTAEEWCSRHDPKEVIIGVDEAGRGAWAGPIVVGVLELRMADYPWASSLRDSKVCTPKQRNHYARQIAGNGTIRWEVCEVSNTSIDKDGIDLCTAQAAVWAMGQLYVTSMRQVRWLLDGNPGNWHTIVHDWLRGHVNDWYFMPKADALEAAVSGASILAKVHHDAVMAEEGDDDNRWGFLQNMGYGSAQHRKLLIEHGPSPFHRMSYAPMKDMFDG